MNDAAPRVADAPDSAQPSRSPVGAYALILTALFWLLVALKLTGPLADLPWLWVSAPLWPVYGYLAWYALLLLAVSAARRWLAARTRRAETRPGERP